NSRFELSNVILSGQNLAPVYNDGNQGNGGLVHHDGGRLLLRDVTLRNGRSHTQGGALFSSARGDLTLQRVLVEDNQAFSGGGLALSGDDFSFVSIEDSRVSGNFASFAGGGMSLATSLAAVTLLRSTVDDNESAYGGGISAASS